MDDLLSEFLTETNESLAVLDIELVKLEQNPDDPELLSNIFRLMHTIKGTCGFLGLPRLEAVAHAGENVLGKVRDGELVVTSGAVSIILECLDRVRSILSVLEETEGEPEGDDSELIDRLNELANNGESGGAEATGESPLDVVGAFDQLAVDAGEPEQEDAAAEAPEGAVPESEDEPEAAAESAEVDAQAPVDEPAAEPMAESMAEPMAEPMAEAMEEAEVEAMAAAEPEPEALPPAPAAAPEPAAKPVAQTKAASAKPAAQASGGAAAEGGPKESTVANQSIRVSVEVLENLMTMVSELVLTRNQCLQILRTEKESEFAAPLQRLNHVVSELQEGVMQTRMQPIGNAWAKLPRIIRDLSHELGKKIELVMKGAETELDRQVLDLIKDPLTHMVRNSADHGLEMPADRAEAGKTEVGTVMLNAYHEGGHIIIEISDDGRGLNIDKIKAKAIANGLAAEADLDALNDQQIMQYIFKPGFSTAEKVTAVSGRGVGMDVVRTNIEKIGGTIELSSAEGKGSKFVIKIPLTLAIVSALIVECGGERFAIPQLSVVELVRASANSEHTIERIKDTPVLRLRNRLLPLVNLRDLLGLAPTEGQPEDATAPGADAFIVVAQVGTYSFGIIVDRVFDTEEIVVKPVAPILRNISLFSGNTILGDGSVVMILDPNGIAAATGEISVAEGSLDAAEQKTARGHERVAMLVFRADGDSPKAVPLALVARLEEIERTDIEHSNGQNVVQYRGQLMPLVSMDSRTDLGEEGRQPVLVFSDRDRSMGLVVDEIVDIVEDRMKIELSTDRPGYLGSAVIQGKATDIVDAGYYLTQAFHDWFGLEASNSFGEQGASRILLVDDSPFFRNLLSPLLAVAGYEVTTAAGGEEALRLCESGEVFDVIISDIEMPGMNGFDFAEAIRNGSRWSETPIVALSSHATPKDLARGRTAGFKDYVAKFDRDALLSTLQETLAETRGAA